MPHSRYATKVLCIVPISTTGMTRDLRRLYPSTDEIEVVFIDGRDISDCPPCIENDVQAVASSRAVLPRATEYINANRVDAVLVCCFSDHPLVYALREKFDLPITGIFQAALQEATQADNNNNNNNNKFGIVTTAKAWEEILSDSVTDLGYATHSAGVSSTGLGVLELESLGRDFVVDRIATCSKQLVGNGARTIILGCAGMAELERDIRSALPSTVVTVDGVRAGIRILSELSRQTSGTGNEARANDTKSVCAVRSEELIPPLRTVV